MNIELAVDPMLPTKDIVAMYSLLTIEQKKAITAFLQEAIRRQRSEPEPA
jgi:hypothetical protein